MKESTPRIDGDPSRFRSTQWSVVLRARSPEDPASRESLGALIRVYWKPVYSYVRRRWGRSTEDSQDLTQAFFADLISRPFLDNVDPSKGRFRTFLLACLGNFIRNQADLEQALKRGGGATVLSIDWTASGERPIDPASKDGTPEELFHREWELAVLSEATRRLRESYAKENRPVYFEIFEAYDLNFNPSTSYGELAAKVGLKEMQVTNHLAHARRRFRSLIEEVIRESVATEEEVRAEIDALFRRS